MPGRKPPIPSCSQHVATHIPQQGALCVHPCHLDPLERCIICKLVFCPAPSSDTLSIPSKSRTFQLTTQSLAVRLWWWTVKKLHVFKSCVCLTWPQGLQRRQLYWYGHMWSFPKDLTFIPPLQDPTKKPLMCPNEMQ